MWFAAFFKLQILLIFPILLGRRERAGGRVPAGSRLLLGLRDRFQRRRPASAGRVGCIVSCYVYSDSKAQRICPIMSTFFSNFSKTMCEKFNSFRCEISEKFETTPHQQISSFESLQLLLALAE